MDCISITNALVFAPSFSAGINHEYRYLFPSYTGVCVIVAAISTKWRKKHERPYTKEQTRLRYKGFHYQSELHTILHRPWLWMGWKKTHSTLTLTTIKFVLVVDKRRNHILAQFFSSALQLALFRSHCKLHRGSNLFLFCSPLTQNRMVCISHCCVCFFNLTLWHWVFCSLSLFSAYCSFNMRLEMNRNTNQCDWKIDVHWYAGEQITRSAHLIVSTKRHILSSIVYQCTYLLFVDTRRETEPNKKKCPESKILLSSHAIPCLSWFFFVELHYEHFSSYNEPPK